MERPYPHLDNAPITEALIDIRFTTADVLQPEVMESAAEQILNNYPNKDARRAELFKLDLNNYDVSPEMVDKGIIGYTLRNQELNQVVQFMRDRFTYSRLKPYVNWEQLRDEAKSLWDLYCNTISPVTVYRVAVRYINRLEIPSNLRDFEDYLTASPPIPQGLPQGLASFLTKIVIPNDEIGAHAIVHQVFEEVKPNIDGTVPETLPVILDIDAIKIGEYEPTGKAIWDILEGLHDYKNDIFFKSVTDITLEPYL